LAAVGERIRRHVEDTHDDWAPIDLVEKRVASGALVAAHQRESLRWRITCSCRGLRSANELAPTWGAGRSIGRYRAAPPWRIASASRASRTGDAGPRTALAARLRRPSRPVRAFP